ncbi:MAG: ABC transporter substrate-binding protein [Actinobacteria bacterium]|nr:ABC transporter substrate-binding protein [Actinomycetota bacterium]
MFRRGFMVLVSVLVAAAFLVGCSSGSSGPAPKNEGSSKTDQPAAAKDPIRIGVVTSLTGPAAATGQQVAVGVKLAALEWNAKGGIGGRKIEVQVEDDQYKPSDALNAYNKIMAQKPVAVVLPTFAQLVMALEPNVKASAIPHFTSATGTAITKVGNPWFFRLRTNDEIMGRLIADFALKELKTKKPGIIYANNDYGKGGYETIKAVLEKTGTPLAAAEAFNSGDKDVSAQLLKLKKAGVDLIISYSTPADSATIALQQKQLGLGVPFLGSPGWGVREFFDLVKGAADGNHVTVDFVPGNDERTQKWAKAIEDNFKGTPVSFVVSTNYDGANILFSAIEKVGTDPNKLREALLATQNYSGITGTYSFDSVGNGLRQAVFSKIENNSMKVLKTIKIDKN